ncbi:hypothetical protein Aau02nite_70950 [Amorphoplanes auranticolor]|uniref:Uncharacterized protein n=1 Tax=Actinoplanes auranticolor TaxID=47988 RepID=A0A919SQC5_9ACTN|nr:hypothetical protein Aau02nite_70950 [Actinoplanes auranticolor]
MAVVIAACDSPGTDRTADPTRAGMTMSMGRFSVPAPFRGETVCSATVCSVTVG